MSTANRGILPGNGRARFAPSAHVFVDESKSRGYFVAAAAVTPAAIGEVDKRLRSLTRRGQDRIHFKSEADTSRRNLLARMCELEVKVHLYVARGYSDKIARTMCLSALIYDLAASGASRLVLERDESVLVADRQTIGTALSAAQYQGSLDYKFARPKESPTLWISDAVAWCQQAGGDWVRRSQPLVGSITQLG